MKSKIYLTIALALALSLPLAASASSYLPGQTLNPSCPPTDPTCVVVANTAGTFVATSTTATSTFAGNVSISGTTAIGSLNGILKAVAGVITTALVNLSSDVTGILGTINGGTGLSSAPSYGQVLVGNGSGGYTLTATSSLGIAGASSQWANTGSNIYFNTGYLGIGTTTPSALVTIDSTSTTGSILRLSNGSAGGHIFDLLSTGSSNTGGAGRLDIFDTTAGAARLSIAANGNVGVGTTSPYANFSVAGNGYFSGNLTSTGAVAGLTLKGQGAGVYGVPFVMGTAIHTFGDSITYGIGASSRSVDYASLLSADIGANLTNYGISGEQACDMGDAEIFPNENPASTTLDMIYTVLIGTNDATIKGAGAYEAIFNTCEQAAISWLAIPSQYKVFGQSASSTTTGTWSSDNTYQTGIGLQSTTNGSTLALPIITNGGPIYIWYRIKDGNGGTFTYNVDGGANTNANAFTVPTISTSNGGTQGVALARISNVAAGSHIVNFTVTSATGASNIVSILGIGAVPVITYQAPKVFVGGVIYRGSDVNSSATSAYNSDVANNVNLLGADGLPVYFVNVRNYVNSTTDISGDGIHPNNIGHQHLRDAFEATAQFVPSTSYANPYSISSAFGAPSAAAWMSATSAPYYSIAIGSGALGTTPTSTAAQFNLAIGGSALSLNVTGKQNTAVASNALFSNTTGNYNDALGVGALQFNTTGGANNAFGVNALFHNTTGGSNEAIGNSAMAANTTGSNNTAIGDQALSSNTTGTFNTAIGGGALGANTTGIWNMSEGVNALSSNTTGNYNTGDGMYALLKNITGSNNAALGTQALYFNTSATSSAVLGYEAAGGTANYHNQGSTVMGYEAGFNFQTGSDYNTLFGFQSGTGMTTGTRNILIGPSTVALSNNQVTTGSFNIAIGNDVAIASSTLSNQLDIGNFIYGTGLSGTGVNVSPAFIGLGTSTPYSRLEVWGPDTASTSAFAIVNSASTTEFTIYDTGNAVLAGSLTQNSDQRLKTNIENLDASSSLAAINALNPVTFNWIDPNKGAVPQYGFIAQQVEQVFPDLVSTTSPTALTPDGTLSLNYIDLISPVVKAIQALSSEIASLTSTVSGFANSFATQHFSAHDVTTQQLCVGSTCINQQQLAALLASQNQSPSSQSIPSTATTTPPVISINGANPAIIQVGATYNDLGATITGPVGDTDLDITTYVNGAATNPIALDTSSVATDTIDYVVTDQNGLTSTSTRTVIIEAPAAVNATGAASTAQ